MSIRERVERLTEKLSREVEIVVVECTESTEHRQEPDYSRMRKGVHSYSGKFAADLLRAVLEELRGNYADMTSADDGVNIRNTGVAMCIGTITSAIGELEGKEK